MSNEKKGITVKIDADLHAEIKQYLESKGMTMAQFIEAAVDNELHPKFIENTEETNMKKMRTLAFQVPEYLFQKIKDYLQRNNLSQKQFVIGLIEREIDRDLTERAELKATEQPDKELIEDELDEDTDLEETDGDFDEADEDEDIDQDEEESEGEEFSEDEEETTGLTMCGM